MRDYRTNLAIKNLGISWRAPEIPFKKGKGNCNGSYQKNYLFQENYLEKDNFLQERNPPKNKVLDKIKNTHKKN